MLDQNQKQTIVILETKPEPAKKPIKHPEVEHDCGKGFAVRLQSGKLWCTACGDLPKGGDA